VKKRRSVLRRRKLLMQLLLGLLIGFVALRFTAGHTIDVPFSDHGWHWERSGGTCSSWSSSGTTNAVNLTDSLDSLPPALGHRAAEPGVDRLHHRSGTRPGDARPASSGCIVGACLGFPWFNTFPADIFMGDTGSLGWGAIAGMAIPRAARAPAHPSPAFVLETLSVIAQVVSFKLFHRRVLLMAPLHHHFEMKAWSETKIIVRFWIIAAIMAGTGFAIYYASF
jgi:phospho-N-acetylmuramoyl-pentapeptide-transferase